MVFSNGFFALFYCMVSSCYGKYISDSDDKAEKTVRTQASNFVEKTDYVATPDVAKYYSNKSWKSTPPLPISSK